MMTTSFPAMGTSCHLQIVGPGARRLAAAGMELVATLEGRWSRFVRDSDVSRINRGPGREIAVDRSTIELLRFAVAAWEATGGTFSPFLGVAMSDVGYSRSWTAAEILSPRKTREYSEPVFESTNNTRLAPIQINDPAETVCIDRGYQLDLGGIAKGCAADMVLAELMRLGATSALVDLGGDMAFSSGPMDPDGRVLPASEPPWRIEVEDPFGKRGSLGAIVAHVGGVATSSTLRRRWNSKAGTSFHHLIDPRTGSSSSSDIAAVTVVADSCMNAEILTKKFVNMGSIGALQDANDLGLDVLIVRTDASIDRVGIWEELAA